MFEAAEATGRTGELDIACLNTVMETAARLRLPGSLTVNLSPRTLETRRLQRPRAPADDRPPRPGSAAHRPRADRARGRRGRRPTAPRRRGVPGRRASASPPTTSAPATPACGCSSQLRFDIVKIDLSLVQGGAVRDTSLEVVQDPARPGRPLGRAGGRRGIETPAQLDVVRSLGIGAGQGYLLGRPTDRPSTEPLDLPSLVSSGADWLIEAVCGRCRSVIGDGLHDADLPRRLRDTSSGPGR